MAEARAKTRKFDGSLLGKALQKAQGLTGLRIEVLISRTRADASSAALLDRLLEQSSVAPDQLVIFANLTTKRAALWSGPGVPALGLRDRELGDWLRALEEDLHQTHPDRALALAVMSLAMVLGNHQPHHQR
jgi:hypothetical protein